jgi:predicted dehydrogenase
MQSTLRAGVIGTGFIGPVHIEALRRIGVQVTAICGGDRAREVAARWAIPHVFTGYDHAALIASPEVDVVHITSPNRQHFEQAAAALRAGKHVVCEKPLAMNTRETRELAALAAERPAQVFAVNYNVRFYPAVLQLRADVAAGRLGEIIHVNGSYFQDWLLKPTDYNWRLLADEGGELRAVGDIGTHWLDTAGFILGTRAESLFAQLSTFHKTRQRPVGEVQTFTNAAPAQTVPYAVHTEDFANILLRWGNGAHGNVAVSQVAAGRKNALRIELYGAERSAWWDSENPNVIRYGSRDGDNTESHRAGGAFTDAAGFTDYPPGHAEGFPDTFKMLYRAVYADIAAGARSTAPLYATAEDGHHEVALCEAILESHRAQQWRDVPSL